MKKKIAIIEEPGAAAEATEQAAKVLKAVAEQYEHLFEFTSVLPDLSAPHLSQDSKDIIAVADAVLFAGSAAAEVIQKEFPLFAIAQPVVVYHSLHHLSPLKNKYIENVNLILYQEPTLTAGEGSRRRIAQSAFEQASGRKQKITFIRTSEAAGSTASWQPLLTQYGKEYPGVLIEHMEISNAIRAFMHHPADFDVIITNMDAGYYLFHQAAALSGTPAMIPSVLATEHSSFFGPAFGIKDADTGKNQVNPAGTILAAAIMLNYFNMHEEALIVRTAVNWTLLHGFVAKDIDPVNNYSTSTIGELISDFIRGSIPGFAKGENMALQKSTII
ncbi:3-isopropylmalate dehydrogenase [Niabella ginsenosidivorans]|uniref:3-isopropylmalate dehydrogenase n=1 Tax=Niabella ginsenosidivorans TaxID=1176587 RepID=A0A1A9HXG1_9BACT|nr:isocitrate/isopropylmalate family dehydrogenase [Niabella ginsenosidivorans]ANH79923.1 3-isopropylmalate dehydrogenase [Niabella ginsenosidivorans]